MKTMYTIAWVVLLSVLLSACGSSQSESAQAKRMKNTPSDGYITVVENSFDFGDIPIMGWKVQAPFVIRNDGPDAIALLQGETSCMCTEAVVQSSEWVISSRIIMAGHGATASVNQILEPWEEATIIVTFDPLAHGPNAVGPIKRDVYIKTNSKKTPQIQVSIQWNVIPGSQKINEPVDVFSFSEVSYDFGTIKQSGGKVSHEFAFVYNWTEPVQVTGVPTSCACTSATIAPTNLNPGDSGILTVKFNPNLHAEPEGRFFKTVSILTDPEVEIMPEVRIWTQIDLDLGPEAFELQSDHVDDDEDSDHEEGSYQSITPEVFQGMLASKDFVLIDTHIPEQEHIAGTDLFIPYDEITEATNLPDDKNAKIVLYCRSGSMSRAAAYELAEHGYTNVYDLVGGKIAYDESLSQ